MTVFWTIFESVGVLLGLGALGFYIIGRRIMPGNVLGFLSPLALDIALPCLIFISIIKNFTLEAFPNWWAIPLWWIFFTILALALSLAGMLISQPGTRREFAISLFYQNGIFFPLAIITGLFGQDSTFLVMLFLFISFHPALFFSTYRFFFNNRTKEEVNWKRIIHPALIMTLVALIIRLLGAQRFIPGFITTQFSLIGAMALPLVMIILGGNIFMDFKEKGRIQTGEIFKFVLVKNFLFPLFFLGVLLVIRPSYPIAMIIFLQSTVPPITAIPIVTQRQGGDFAITNQFIVASYLTLLISIPLMFSLFSAYFPAP
ncbi:MAG: AEC family transporter [Desulfobacter sp.]|nr:MAG: AEC family transporter [Desulfobacter sp.]